MKIEGESLKKIILILSLLITFPIITSAHTTVSQSTPETDEVVTEQLNEIIVEFAGEIENKGTLTLVKGTEEIKIDSLTFAPQQMKGALTTPLKNGSYQLIWKTASKDGHILDGEIPFTVNIPEAEEKALEDPPQSEPENNIEENELQVEDNTDVKKENETVKTNSSTISTVAVIVLVILLAFGIWILLRKKR